MNNELIQVIDNKIVVSEEFRNKLVEFEKLKKEIEYQEKLLKSELVELMPKYGKDEEPIIMEGVMISYRKGTIKKTLDTKRIKEELPDIYETYSKESEVAPTVIIKVAE